MQIKRQIIFIPCLTNRFGLQHCHCILELYFGRIAAGIGLDPFTKLAKIVTPPEREHIFNTACSLAGSKTFAQPAAQIAQTARTAATAAAGGTERKTLIIDSSAQGNLASPAMAGGNDSIHIRIICGRKIIHHTALSPSPHGNGPPSITGIGRSQRTMDGIGTVRCQLLLFKLDNGIAVIQHSIFFIGAAMTALELVPSNNRYLSFFCRANELTVELHGILRPAGNVYSLGNGTAIVDLTAEDHFTAGIARRRWHSAIEVMGQHRLKVFPLLRPFLPSLNTGTIRFKERIR